MRTPIAANTRAATLALAAGKATVHHAGAAKAGAGKVATTRACVEKATIVEKTAVTEEAAVAEKAAVPEEEATTKERPAAPTWAAPTPPGRDGPSRSIARRCKPVASIGLVVCAGGCG